MTTVNPFEHYVPLNIITYMYIYLVNLDVALEAETIAWSVQHCAVFTLGGLLNLD